MIYFGINTTRNFKFQISNFIHLTAREITYNNFEISLVVFMPNITTNHAITDTNTHDTDFVLLKYLTIIPRARMGSESIAHEAEGQMGY